MNVPANLMYTKTHEWVSISDGKARVGLTDYAQDALGDIVFVNLPQVGAAASPGEAVGEVESVKAVSEINSPVGGTVSSANESLADAPEAINAGPYDAWIFELTGAEGAEDLLTSEQYKAFCEEGGD